MMKKVMKLWMHLILFAAFTSAHANPVDCDFEEDSCSWSIEGFRKISDNQLNSTDGRSDIMHRNGSEWYLLFEGANESYATITSIQTTIEGLQCLNFWYIFKGSRKSQIQVFVHGIGGDNASAIWETSRSHTGWRRATVEIDVQYSSMVIMLIRVKTAKSYSEIGIDDIVLKLASCLDCNFQDGLCSWEGKEWNVPTKVNFAVTELQSKEKSVLASGLDIYPGEKCLSFNYQMKDFKRDCIFIDIQSYHKKSRSTVWRSQTQHQLYGWNEINVTINVGNKSKIAIRFQRRNCSDVTYYIRSISLKKQSCTVSTKSSKDTMASNITTPNRITTFVKLSATDIATSTAAGTVNTSTYYPSAHEIIGIGSILVVAVVVPVVVAVVVIVVLVAVCYCRRRKQLNSGTNISRNNTGLYETHNVVFSQDIYDQVIRVTSGRENNIIDRVYYNVEPEYTQIEE